MEDDPFGLQLHVEYRDAVADRVRDRIIEDGAPHLKPWCASGGPRIDVVAVDLRARHAGPDPASTVPLHLASSFGRHDRLRITSGVTAWSTSLIRGTGGVVTHPSAASFSSACRSSSARVFFSAAVLSWPQAASMSRPRGVRTGAEMPASNTISLKRRTRSGVEHS